MKEKQNFTLIELLVVVAIIAILAGILMPALSSALRKAKAIGCTGNQKSLGLALSMYAADNKEFYPSRNYTSSQPYNMWHRALLMCGYLGKTLQDKTQSYDSDKRGKTILTCPEDTNPKTGGTSAGAARDFLSYGLTASLASNESDDHHHYIPRHRLIVGSRCGKPTCDGIIKKGPQETFIISDASEPDYGIACWGYPSNTHFAALPKCMISPRHTTGVPITFVDGHVSFWSYPFSNDSLNFEKDEKH